MGAAHDDGDFAATPAATPAPAPARGGGGVFQVAGLPVEFPYKPYGTQLAFMGRVIATLDRGRRQGRSHALLESPTGTGKSLSLLCAALAWQRHYPLRAPPAPAAADPLLHGGGFLPDDTQQQQQQPTPGVLEKAAAAAKKKKAPTIYYATRTHSQITQVVRELRKTPYRVRMAILASRKHYCVNKSACMTDSVDEECKRLLDDKVHGCLEFKNAQKLSRHPSLQTGGSYEVHDIEDLLKVGRQVKGCPYFAAQTMAEAAQLVFCPYNYLISPIVRRAMDINIAGSIVILDEAHNIEDISRDSGSVDVDEESLNSLAEELAKLATDQAVGKIYQPLHDIIQGLSNWIAAQEGDPRDNEFGRPASFWTGENAVKELQKAGITPAYFPILQECATKAVKAASDTESEGDHLTGRGSVTLESLFSSLSHFFGRNGRHLYDYQLAIQRLAHREGTSAFGVRNVMSLWCLNPAVVFQDIADITHSVILTSGTLSPMGSFASELGVQFDACMEAPHVIDADSQVFASVLSSGPTTHRLNASYKSADAYSFQDELGASIEEICRIVPGGALVFFPSYKLLDKLKVRWSQTGQWARLNAQKPVFVEPRGSTEELEPVLNGYYNAILGKVPLKKGRGGANQIVKNRVRKNSSQESAKGGAAFLAVCRGKVSEGIDFSDDNARVVVIVGIPFPNVNDVQVKLKKKYNDSYKSSKNLLSGSEWYCHQAFRALNQAAGRCIRHKLDYGGIILIDERYQEERNLLHISKWLKNSIKHYGSFQETMDKLEKFFQKAEEHIKIKRQEMSTKDKLDDDLLISCVDKIKLPCPESNFSKNPVLQSNQKGKLDDDLLTSHGDTRKRPWPEPYLSKHSVLQSNQKVKNKRGSLKVSNIDVAGLDRKNYGMPYTSSGACQVSSKSSGLTKKESSPVLGSLSTACQLPPSHNIQSNLEDEADIWGNHEVDINVTDLNNCDSMPGHVKLTIFTPPEGRSQEPTLVEGTSTEDPFVSPSDCSEVNTSAAMYNDEDQVVGMSASLSTANRNQSCVSTSAGTPETTANRGYHLDHESSVNRSVNSQYQKRRRFNIPMSCCTGTEHSNPSLNPSNPSLDPSNPASTSLCNTDCAVSMVTGDLKRTDGQCCKSMEMSRCENFKLERSHKPVEFASNKSAGTKLDIRCTRCKTPLGLQKDGFLVSSSLASPSKFYLTYLFRNGLSTVGFTENLMASPPAVLNVIVCDASSLNQELLSKFCTEGSAHQSGVWSEKDGCVYKAVTCPFCCRENSFAMVLGAQVLAADASNLESLNKVLLFADRLDFKKERSNEQVARYQTVASNPMGTDASNPMSPPPVINLESFAYKPVKKEPVPLSTRRSKLRLPSTNTSTKPHLVHNVEDL
ncbi:Fanconi anemia group J protein homolog [Hordeum vulgare subsp. vulgare]|uniref:DNA 5'-3' helicase FANCJ n=1 Tax=Hordeum vulgare subsp. vulgare TaxID=112509 RepID=A0A8I6XRQ3_HORVV|nr:Fanconi anemia group J protein homolog [Hordeum vulgare subsp. vulgare]